MTDAERIAEYLSEDPAQIANVLADPSRFAWDRTQIKAMRLAKMLSDVRYDERLACTRIIEETIAGLPRRSSAREQVLQEIKEVIATRTRR